MSSGDLKKTLERLLVAVVPVVLRCLSVTVESMAPAEHFEKRLREPIQHHRGLQSAPRPTSLWSYALTALGSRRDGSTGRLGERPLTYCKDEDWPWKARQAGAVAHHPGVVIRHQKGETARQAPFRSLYLYHGKKTSADNPLPVNLAVYGWAFAALGLRLFQRMPVLAAQPWRAQQAPRLSEGMRTP